MRRLLLSTLVLFLLACATAKPPVAAAPFTRRVRPIDLLLTGGTVITMAGADIDNGAVAIDGGEIVAIGPASAIASTVDPRDVIDTRGQVMMPGLVNAHTHAAMTLFRGLADDRELMDWLHNYMFPAEAKNVDRDFVTWGTRLAAAEMIRSGTTTFADMYYFESDVARETKAAGLRGVLGETFIDFPAPDNKTWPDMVASMRRFAAEWGHDPLITPALAPHAPYTVSAEHLKEVRALATELHAPILIHLSETETEVKDIAAKNGGLRPAAYLESLGFLDHDVIAAHAVWLSPEEIELLARRKVGVSNNPGSNMMLASGIAPVVEMRSAGINVGLGTDGPAGSGDNLDMIEEMRTAARLQKVARHDPRALTAHDVLEMATIGGARALGLDSKIGTLEVGKRADIIVIDLRSPKTQPFYSAESAVVYAASGDDVVTTIVDGKILMRDGKLLTVDVPAVLAKATEYRQKVSASLAH